MIEAMIQAGSKLASGEIYSFKILPTLGGEYALENMEAKIISIHFSLFGQIQQQVSVLPLGSAITGLRIS